MEPLLTHFLGELPDDPANALEANPHSCDLWNAKGCDAFAAGDFGAAVKAFSNAVQLSDQYHHYIHYECAASFIVRARWYLAGENRADAKADLDAAIFQDHGALAALLLRAWIAEREGDSAAVEKYLSQGKKYNKDADGLRVPSDWLGAPRYDRALASDLAWAQAIRLPSYPIVSPALSAHDKALALLAGKPAEAAEAFVAHLDHPRAWRHYGMALVASGLRDEAKRALDESVVRHLAWHSAYHRAAATHRLNRAIAFAGQGNMIAAWQDALKAADIDKHWALAKEWSERLAARACA